MWRENWYLHLSFVTDGIGISGKEYIPNGYSVLPIYDIPTIWRGRLSWAVSLLNRKLDADPNPRVDISVG